MKNKLLLILIFCGLGLYCVAQPAGFKEIPAEEKASVLKSITAASKKITSLQLNFVQIKKVSMLTNAMKSQGNMFYQTPMMLRWEYTVPKQPAFVMNGNKAALVDEKGTQTAPNKAFQEVSKLIVNIMSGNELTSGKNFKVYCYSNSKSYWLKMVPVNKRLKQMFSSINLMVNKSTKLASLVRIDEVSGDITTIQFYNVVTNKPINNNLFYLK